MVGVDHQRGQHPTMLRGSDFQQPITIGGLQWPENVDAHIAPFATSP